MSHVLHDTHPGSGNKYVYDHFRDGNQVRCVYIGRAEDVKISTSIPTKGYPVEAEYYKEGHQAGIDAEKEVYGEKRYKELNEHIKDVIPKGELAGSHTPEGKIIIHKNIDKKYHKQLILHEKTEHNFMTSKSCKSPNPGEKLTLSQKRKIEYVMREYEAGKLKTSSGNKVVDRNQAVAIAYRQAGVEKE